MSEDKKINNSIITTAEIARQANVSRGTVDRVLHNRGRVSKETEEKIKSILNQVDYKPNVFARSLKLARPFRFGVIIPNTSFDTFYWDLPRQGIDMAVNELKEHRVEALFYTYENYDESSFERALKKATNAGETIDGLLIAPVFSESAAKKLAKIPEELPFVLLDTNVPDSKALGFIGSDSFKSGVLSARLLHILIKYGGYIAVLRELPENLHIFERINGFTSYFENHLNLPVKIYDADRQVDANIISQTTEQIIVDNPDVSGIFVSGSFAHQVAIKLEELGKEHSIFVIGYDLTDLNRKYLETGAIDFLISNHPSRQGYQGLYTLFRHVVLKRDVEPVQNMPLDIVMKENLEYYSA